MRGDARTARVAAAVLGLVLVVVVWSPAASAGSICRDGTWTPSEGRGTCSWHGGVAQGGVPDPGSVSVPSATPSPTATPTPTPTPTATPAPAPTPTPVVVTHARQFAALKVKIRKPRPVSRTGTTYVRSAFRLWTTRDGCTTRQLVLIEEAIGGTRAGCLIPGASWHSLYDGVDTANPSTFDIDHVVPLKEAWLSGAANWTPARRTAFANDLGYADSLIAVSASSNRSKGDRDPARWMPPDPAEACAYVAAWVAVKWRWDLTMDTAERAKVTGVLAGCDGLAVTLPAKAS